MAAPPLSLTFLGAAGTATGSKHLLKARGRRILVDYGLFQGLKELRLRNWGPLSIDLATIDAVIVTHARRDPCGYLPRLVSAGYRGRTFCTPVIKTLTYIQSVCYDMPVPVLIDDRRVHQRGPSAGAWRICRTPTPNSDARGQASGLRQLSIVTAMTYRAGGDRGAQHRREAMACARRGLSRAVVVG